MSYRALRNVLSVTIAAVLVAGGAAPMYAEDEAASDNPVVIMETTEGTLKIELYPEDAPISVKNFLWYVENKFFDGLIFHRIVPGFVIQGGAYTKDMVKKQPNPPIENEATNGLSNDAYTLSMARTNAINSATSQFFINLKDNPALDHMNNTDRYGYAVFGKVIEGQEFVDKIGKMPTATKSGMADVPVTTITMTKVYVAKDPGKKMKAETTKQ